MGIRDFLATLTGRTITIYADFIDPFCYIGFHNLRSLTEARGITLDWRGFELNPGTPPEGLPLVTAGNSDLRPGMWASVQGFARQAGLELPEPRHTPNTLKAHALVELAAKMAIKNPLIEQIYQAYFIRQQDIGQDDVLAGLASSFGIPLDRVQDALSNPRLPEKLEARRDEAKRRAFLGLPGYVYKGKNYFGALSADAWEKILKGDSPHGR